ncbi:MAG: hypothetical protein AABN95_16915 [Acidobacteriota bacterium]
MRKHLLLAHVRPVPYENEHQKPLEEKTKELHTNVRHITQLGMSWFAFLVTTNYLAMTWLKPNPPVIIWTIAIAFMIQNALGIVGIGMVHKTAASQSTLAHQYERELLRKCDVQDEKDLPYQIIDLYKWIARFLMIVLGVLSVAWIFIGGVLQVSQ